LRHDCAALPFRHVNWLIVTLNNSIIIASRQIDCANSQNLPCTYTIKISFKEYLETKQVVL
jgi:hypothetical protein